MSLVETEALTVDGWAKAIDMTGNGIPAPPARIHLATARNKLWDDEYRAAVIDAGTAVELALWRMLEQKVVGVSPVIFDRLTQNLTLGRLRDVLSSYGLPANLNEDLIQVRNHVVHKGLDPSIDACRKAVRVCGEVVDMVYPPAPGLAIEAGF